MGLLVHREAGLSAGAAHPDEEVCAADRRGPCREIPGQAGNDEGSQAGNDGFTEAIDDGAGEDGGLVVAAGAKAGPVEGDGDDQVDVREVRGGREATAEKGAEVAPGGQVAVVLLGARDRPVVPFVMHQGHGVGIIHRLRAPVTFQHGIEPIGQRIMRLQPIPRIRHIGRTVETQMPLAHAQLASASQAYSRHEQVAKGQHIVMKSALFPNALHQIQHSTHRFLRHAVRRDAPHSHPGWGPKTGQR